MTEYFKIVKTQAQDDPCSVDQIRALYQNNHWIRSIWRNCLFAASWQYGALDSMNILETDLTFPDVLYPVGITSVLVSFNIYNDSGAAYDATFAFDIFDSFLAGIEFTETQTLTTGDNWFSFDLTLDYGSTFETEIYKKGGIRISCTGTGVGDSYYHDVSVHGILEQLESVDPQLFEQASNLHLRTPASVINTLGTVPQFLGGWIASGGVTISRDGAAATPESFRLFHLHDYADDQISEDKNYYLGIARKGLKTDVAETFNAKLYLLESTEADSSSHQVYESDIIRQNITGVTGESYSTGAGVESVAMVDVWSTGGSADSSVLLSIGIWASDPAPYSDNRSQSANRTAVDSEYFEATQGSIVDYETIQGVGRAQFNSVYRRSGQSRAIMFREGQNVSLTTSLVDFWWLSYFIGENQHWQTGRKSKLTLTGSLCVAMSATGIGTIEFYIHSTAAGDSDTISSAYSSGMNYLSMDFELEAEDSGDLVEQLKIKARDKSTAQTVKIYSVWIASIDISETY